MPFLDDCDRYGQDQSPDRRRETMMSSRIALKTCVLGVSEYLIISILYVSLSLSSFCLTGLTESLGS